MSRFQATYLHRHSDNYTVLVVTRVSPRDRMLNLINTRGLSSPPPKKKIDMRFNKMAPKKVIIKS